MYVPPPFALRELPELHAVIRAARVGYLVTQSDAGLQSTLLPLFVDPAEGEFGTLYGHVARGNPQWKSSVGEAMVLFTGPNAYVTPSWYATKAATGKVVPTWNYLAVEAHGRPEFFEDPDRLLAAVTRLTNIHEHDRNHPWAVSDAPPEFVASQLRCIVGVRIPIDRIEGKSKMSQNRSAEDRAGVIAGLAASVDQEDVAVAHLIPRQA